MQLIMAFLLVLLGCSSFDVNSNEALSQLENMVPETYFEPLNQRSLADGVTGGDIGRIEEAVEQGADVNYLGREGMTPLMWGLAKQSYDGTLALLELGADPNMGTYASSPMEVAAIMQDSRFLRTLLDHGGNVETGIGRSGRTVLFAAVLHRRQESIRMLAEQGANINHQTNSGQSPIRYAISTMRYRSALLLLKLGADPKIEDRWGFDAYEIFEKYAGNGLSEGGTDYRDYKELERALVQHRLKEQERNRCNGIGVRNRCQVYFLDDYATANN